MGDQSMENTEKMYQAVMFQGINSQGFEKSQKKQIWSDLKARGKLSRSSSSSDQDLSKELVAFYFQFEQKGSYKDLDKYFDKGIQQKMENVFKFFYEQIIKPNESKRQEFNQMAANQYLQQPQYVDNDQFKYIHMIQNHLQNIPSIGLPQNAQQQLLTHGYNQNPLITPYLSFQGQTDLSYMPFYQQMQNQYIHPSSNQGTSQLQPTYMYRNSPAELMPQTGINPSFSTQPNYMQNPLVGNLGQQVGFMGQIPLQNQNIGYPYNLTQQGLSGTAQNTLDQQRLQNSVYYQLQNSGFGKNNGTDNNFNQFNQIALQEYPNSQATNQSIQQQKLAQNQKLMQAPYQPQNQQQFQIQQQSQIQQGQLPQLQQQQQQQQQVQNQQQRSIPQQKSKQQQSSSNNPQSTSSQSASTAVVPTTSNSKQVSAQAISQQGSKSSKVANSDIFQQKSSQNQGATSKSKSKNSSGNNNNNNQNSTTSGSQNNNSAMNNQMNNQYNQQQLTQLQNGRNGAGASINRVEIEAIKSCICSQAPRLRNSASELIQCKNKGCDHKLHLSCMKISPKDEESVTQFECPSCILKKYDPLHHVEQVLVDCQVMMQVMNKTYDFNLTNDVFAKIRDNPEYHIEVRCIRIDGTKNIYETTWPDFGCMKINNEQVFDLKPLQNNSSLKKRKDEKHTFKGTKGLKEGINHLQISEYTCNQLEKQQMRITENAVHCISVFLIRRLTVEQLANNIRRDFIRPAQECKQQIQDYFNRQHKTTSLEGEEEDDDEICIDSLSVPLTCNLDMKLIQTPAKGRYCKHFQCFSLENFIITTETVNPRKWRCNICKAKCYDLVVDEYILKIIQEINEKQIKNVTDVKFDGKGQYFFDQQSYSDDDDDYDDDSQKIVIKKAASTSNQVNTPSAAAAVTTPNANPQQAYKGSNAPKGVSLDSHSNSMANDLQSMQQQQQPQQQQGQNKRKPQFDLIEIDSGDDEPIPPPAPAAIQNKAVPVTQPKQVSVNIISQPYQQIYTNQQQQQQQSLLQQQQQQQPQTAMNLHHHHIVNQFSANNNGNGQIGGIGINPQNGLNYNLINNNNAHLQAQNLINQKNMIPNSALLDPTLLKNLQNSNNSLQTANTGNNTVNSQNITSMIPPINQDKGQSSNQSPKNIQSKSKKNIQTEDEKQEPSKLQNQQNINKNNYQKSLPPVNQKDQKLNSEELQRELASKQNNKIINNNTTQNINKVSNNEAALQKLNQKQKPQQQQLQQQPLQQQQQSQPQKQLQQQIQQNQQNNTVEQDQQNLNLIKQQNNQQQIQQQAQFQQQKQQIRQPSKQQMGGNNNQQPQQPIFIDIEDSDPIDEYTPPLPIQQEQRQKQQVQQNAMKIVQIVSQKDNTRIFNDYERLSGNIGINTKQMQNPLYQIENNKPNGRIERTQSMQKYFEQHKIEEMSVSGDNTSKSNLQANLTEKDIQNIERKRILCEQNLDQSEKTYLDEFLSTKNPLVMQTNSNDSSYKSKLNGGSNASFSNQDSGTKIQGSTTAQSPSNLNMIFVHTQIQNIINYFSSELSQFILSSQEDDDIDNKQYNDVDQFHSKNIKSNQNFKQVHSQTFQSNENYNFEGDINDDDDDGLDFDNYSSNIISQNIQKSQNSKIFNFNSNVNSKKIQYFYPQQQKNINTFIENNFKEKMQSIAANIKSKQKQIQNKSREDNSQTSFNFSKSDNKMQFEQQFQTPTKQQKFINTSNQQKQTNDNLQNTYYSDKIHHINHQYSSKQSSNQYLLKEWQLLNEKQQIKDILEKKNHMQKFYQLSIQHLQAREFERDSSESDSPLNLLFQQKYHQQKQINSYDDNVVVDYDEQQSSNLYKNNSLHNKNQEMTPIQFEKTNSGSQKRKMIENTAQDEKGLSKKRIYEKLTNQNTIDGQVDNPICIDD